jgi:plastocyanin
MIGLRLHRGIAVLAVATLAVVAACGDDDATETTTTAVTTTAAVTTSAVTTTTVAPGTTIVEGATITVANFQFTPADVEITVGQTVAFIFTSGTHTASAVDGSWSSGEKSAGGNFEIAFDEPGTFDFVCQIHGSMQGTITVTG